MKKDTVKICFMPMKYYLPVAAILIVSVLTDSLNDDLIGTLALLMVCAGLLRWLGKRTPFIGKWLGGEILFPLLGGSILGSFGILSPRIIGNVTDFMSSGFTNLIVGAAITGSILTIDRNKVKDILLTTLVGAVIAIACAVLFMLLGSWITGKSILEGVYLTGLPNFCGGPSGCLVSVPAICSGAIGGDSNEWSGKFMVTLVLTNTFCICAASILGQRGKAAMQEIKQEKNDPTALSVGSVNDAQGLGRGCIFSVMILVAGALLSHFFPFLNYISWATILALLLKSFNLLDNDTACSAAHWQEVLLGMFIPSILLGCGIVNIDLKNAAFYILWPVLLITFLGVCGSILGAFAAAKLLRKEPIDMMIGIGCNTATLGGTGNVAVLSSAKRMDLMTCATIACRIGGALTLVFYDISIRLLL